ncbi:uncharacterized protein BO80DRAFT_198235 [Aspergillus ibericus CBS 121593]|uniref:Uncharacterized protein n=1 Tax=Aspergillus ibericus CBS 121593 TaxID=1448316 RepID=A0A395GNR3_9EURO|nr:hypothetical protein BO80DRAFT_198235 [Aspergillus ibericus CBS 121593]RAK97119.1 hypothetical protein BO80DRAFT_198235 [Aspergillus ibericus CBS 121593]
MISPRPILESWRRSRPDVASEHVHGLFPTSGPSGHGSHVQVPSWVLPPYPSRQVSSAARVLRTLRIILVTLCGARRPRHAPRQSLTFRLCTGVSSTAIAVILHHSIGLLGVFVAGQSHHTQLPAPQCTYGLCPECRSSRQVVPSGYLTGNR